MHKVTKSIVKYLKLGIGNFDADQCSEFSWFHVGDMPYLNFK